mgnify:CR=1 FL=1
MGQVSENGRIRFEYMSKVNIVLLHLGKMTPTDSCLSRLPGFYKLPPEQRLALISERFKLSGLDQATYEPNALNIGIANVMVENVVGTFCLPMAVGINFIINT